MNDECRHDNVEWEPGNHVPPYGWEIYPGHYCIDCGEMVEYDEVDYPGAPGPDEDYDLARKMELEDEMRNSL